MERSLNDAGRLAQLRSAVGRRVSERPVLFRNVTVVLLAIMVALLVTLLALKMKTKSPAHLTDSGQRQKCSSVACLRQAADALSWMNSSVLPCSNFYQHVCGRFNVMNPRGDRSMYGIKEKLEDYNRKRLQELLQETNYDVGTAFNKTATLFQSCMNVDEDLPAVQHLVDLINSMGGLELFGTWSPEHYNFQSTLTKLLGDPATATIFGLTLTNQRELVMHPSHIRLSRRTVRTMTSNVRTILQTLPINVTACNSSRCLDQMVDDVLDIEKQLNNQAMDQPLKISVSLLDQTMDEVNWTQLLDQLYGSRYVTINSTVTVYGVSYVKETNNIIKNTLPKKMQHFLMWSLILDSLPTLGEQFFSFYNEIQAVDVAKGIGVKSRSDYCMDTVRRFMPQVASALFLHTHVGLDSQDAAATLFDAAKEVLFEYSGFFNASHLSHYQNMSVHFGRANTLADIASIDAFYEPLELNSSIHYFNAYKAVHEFRTAKLRQELAEDPSNAVLTAAEDGRHQFVSLRLGRSGTLLLPLGALQPPWFNAQLPPAVNAAALGSIILQTFFAALAQDEAQAAYRWKKQSITAFNRYQICISESFSKLEVFPGGNTTFAGVTVSKRSIGALNDHFALKSSWRLFDRLNSQSISLDGLDFLSSQQLFFTAFAQARCRNAHPFYMFYELDNFPTEDVINNLMYNDEAFKQAFQCNTVPHKYANKRQCELPEV